VAGGGEVRNGPLGHDPGTGPVRADKHLDHAEAVTGSRRGGCHLGFFRHGLLGQIRTVPVGHHRLRCGRTGLLRRGALPGCLGHRVDRTLLDLSTRSQRLAVLDEPPGGAAQRPRIARRQMQARQGISQAHRP